jgi:hypothetical protein
MKNMHKTGYGILVAFALVPMPALAQDAPEEPAAVETASPSQDDIAAARSLALEATRAYESRDYVEAANLYKLAYKRVPAAIFLSSAARAAYEGGSLTHARRLAADALGNEAIPLDDAERAKTEKLADEIEQAISVELARTGEWSWVGYTGAGVAALGVGSIVGTLVVSAGVDARRDELAASTRRSEYDPLFEELSAQQRLGQTLLYSGVGLLVVGGGLVAWDLLTPGGVPYEKPTVALGVGADGAQVQVGWRW